VDLDVSKTTHHHVVLFKIVCGIRYFRVNVLLAEEGGAAAVSFLSSPGLLAESCVGGLSDEGSRNEE
jgi:hypothetical protein